MKIQNKKRVAGIELVLMLISVFAFSYMLHESEPLLQEVDEAYKSLKKIEQETYKNVPMHKKSGPTTIIIGKALLEKIKRPLIPVVSAEETLDIGAGCCALTVDGSQCATATQDTCEPAAAFAEGSLCATTSFCKRGCCFNKEQGIYDSNVIEAACTQEWIPDPNCNVPEAARGCCVLGSRTVFETRAQCEIDTEVFARSESGEIDWRPEVGEAACALLSETQEEGACIFSDASCTLDTRANCLNNGGEFSEGLLCTASVLDTACKPTDQTTCVDGKDAVYFLDSCGNVANIYDASKREEQAYWEEIIEPDDACIVTAQTNNQATCGNCNRFTGGICASAIDDGFNVEWGNYYCRDTSCTFEGESYKNGESWCVYDGKVGDGDDVVGSRHWKYVCNQGNVDIEPCADYRNQLCVQQNTFEFEGDEVSFRNAACVPNNWRECVSLNSEEDGTEKCEEALNCEIRTIDISEHFKFNTCTPKYPGGFDLKDARYSQLTQNICSIATTNCTVVRQSNFFGTGCELVANKECLDEDFTVQMNNFCRSLGDCGGSVNIAGEYEDNYKIKRDGKTYEGQELSRSEVSKLIRLATPVAGNFAEVEDYTRFLEAAGVFGGPGAAPSPSDPDPSGDITTAATGLGGLGLAAGMLATGSLTLSGLGATAATASSSFVGPLAPGLGAGSAASGSLAAFSGVAIGAAIGAIAGIYLADLVGASPFGTILMAAGGALIGGLAGAALIGVSIIPVVGWAVAIVGALLLIIGALFSSADCNNIEVQFECKVWQPPAGGSDCEKCNEDPLKPCSEYRCQSLGAACELINKGTDEELCQTSEDDGRPPHIEANPLKENTFDYEETPAGLTISDDGQCIGAYTPVIVSLSTSEPALCKFDVEQTEFENMEFDFGNLYKYNHTIAFPLPDPSHGESRGAGWSGELELYVLCQDTQGNLNRRFYEIEMCVHQGPDTTSPRIVQITPEAGGLVSFDEETQDVRLITNELATCKWDANNVGYDTMTNSLSCQDSLLHPASVRGYECNGEFQTPDFENVFYISCTDQPWLAGTANESKRNTMFENYVYKLRKPEKKLEIDAIYPNEAVVVDTAQTTIQLQVQTSGGGIWHHCSYSLSGYNTLIEFFETGAERIHEQPLNLPIGNKTIYVQCIDELGDSARASTSFEIRYGESIPDTMIARVWKDSGNINIVTTQSADCRYALTSCGFDFENASRAGEHTLHQISATPGRRYYVKCINEEEEVPRQCSLVVQST